MRAIEKTAQQIGEVLDSAGLDGNDLVEFLADEFSDEEIVTVFRVAYGAEKATRNSIKRSALFVQDLLTFTILNKALKQAGRKPIPEPKRSKGEMTLELQGTKGQPIIWGKTYGDGIPIMQISFMKSDLKAAGPFLRSLGFTIVDERDDD